MKRSVGCGCCGSPICNPCAEGNPSDVDILTLTISGVLDNGCTTGDCDTFNDSWELEQIRSTEASCEWWYGGFPGDIIDACVFPSYAPLVQVFWNENPSTGELRMRLLFNVAGTDAVFFSQDLGVDFDDIFTDDDLDCTSLGTLNFTHDSGGTAGACDLSAATITGVLG